MNDFNQIALEIKQIGKNLGFDHIGITDPYFHQETVHLKNWLHLGYHGDMQYFAKHLSCYENPQKLLSNTSRIICCKINYPPPLDTTHPIASFAQTQDYSSHISNMLKEYAAKILKLVKSDRQTKVFSGNAPILEKALAAKAGLGWYGKNSILLNEQGSYFFLGEILLDLPLPLDQPIANRCGNCFKCKTACPTQAIVKPYTIDTRRCISYLTIEHKGSIPLELRPLIGIKIFGCDICQEVCPWNKHKQNYAKSCLQPTTEFATIDLVRWFMWDENEFNQKTIDLPIKRLGYERWLRNIAVALGNLPKNAEITNALQSRLNHPSELVCEHVQWALTTLDATLLQRRLKPAVTELAAT